MSEAKKKPEIRKGHCPECGPDRYAEVISDYKTSWDDNRVGIWGSKDWRILKCRGCETVYFQTSEFFSEDTIEYEDETGQWCQELNEKIAHWPAPLKRAEPEWSWNLSIADKLLGNLFQDIYGALNADLAIPAAIAMRTVFDRASEVLGVDPSLSFGRKLDDLVANGKISHDERETLAALIDAGSAAVHRGWRPKPTELDVMAQLTEAFLHRTFVLGSAASELKKGIPAKPHKKKRKGGG